MGDYEVLLSYGHVHGVPRCPCADPGNYMSVERSKSDPLALLFRCWCGSTMKAQAENVEEVERLVATRRI